MNARLRMLMNAQSNDGSPGGGAASGAGASASAPAQGAGGSADVIGQVKELLAGELKSFRDGVFADLRKAGALGKGEKPKEGEGGATTGGQQASAAPDFRREATRQRHLGQVLHGLPDAAQARIERLYDAEQPEDVLSWGKQVRVDLGLDKGAGGGGQTTTPAPAAGASANANPPKSDRGGQAGHVITDDTPVIDMSNEDRDAWIKQNGVAKYYRRVQSELKGRRIRIQPRS